MKDLLPLLLILACPLMMLFMMRGMHGRGAHAADRHPGSEKGGVSEGRQDAEVATLREQRAQLEARVEELEAQMSRLEGSQEAELRIPTPV